MAPLVSLSRWQRRAIFRLASHAAAEDCSFVLQQPFQLGEQARLLVENAAQMLADVGTLQRHIGGLMSGNQILLHLQPSVGDAVRVDGVLATGDGVLQRRNALRIDLGRLLYRLRQSE